MLAEHGLDKFRGIVEKAKNEAINYMDAVIENEDKIEVLREIAKLELESDKEIYINKLAKKYGITARSLKKDLKTISNDNQITVEDQEPYDPLSEYTEDEIAKAKELLSDPELLNKIVSQISKNRHVGETLNKKILRLSFTSRLLNKAISNVIKGESSSGKNALVEAVLKVIPDSEYITYTRITPQSLYYLEGLDLSHKILFIYESHGSAKADYSIRSSISEGELRLLVTDTNEKTGTKAKEIVIPAKGLSYVETTTMSNINPENQTRLFDLYIDTSEKQTREIFRTQSKLDNEELINKENRPYEALQLILKPYDVYIPYGETLAEIFPSNKTRTRRDHPRFQTLIKANCLLHQYQREEKEINGKTYLVATIDDYKIAYELSQVVLAQTLKEITPRQERILEAIKKHFSDSEFTQKDVRVLKELKDIHPRILKDEISNLKDSGYLEHNGEKGKNSRYELVSIPQEMLKLPTPEELLSMCHVSTSQSEKNESKQGVNSDYWDMSQKRPNVSIEADSDVETELGHVPKNDYNSPELFDNDGLGRKDIENAENIFSKVDEMVNGKMGLCTGCWKIRIACICN